MGDCDNGGRRHSCPHSHNLDNPRRDRRMEVEKMNYQKAWEELRKAMIIRANEEALSVMATIEKEKKEFAIVEAYDPILEEMALRGHMDCLEPSEERLQRFKKSLIERKLGYYVTKHYRPKDDVDFEWLRSEDRKRKFKDVSDRLEWKVYIGEWK